jgi:hypothetical protein
MLASRAEIPAARTDTATKSTTNRSVTNTLPAALRSGTIIDACTDPTVFARWFRDPPHPRWFRDPETWRAWFVFSKALFGLPVSDHGAEIPN